MEVHVHGNATFSIPIYDLDSDASILRRLCAHQNTLPEYVVVPERGLSRQRSITLIDLMEIMKRDANTLDLAPVYSEIRPYNFDTEKIMTAWVMTRDIPKELDAYHVSVIMYESIRTIFPQYKQQDIENLVSRRTGVRDEFLVSVQELQKEDSEFTGFCSHFQGLEPYETTPFREEHFVFRIWIPNPERFTLREIFNRIRVNPRFYYASFGKIVKLRSSLQIPENRDDEEETDGCLRIYESDKDDPISVSEHDPERLTVRVSMKTDDHAYVRDILDFLSFSSMEKMEKIGISGVFYLKDCQYNSYIMRDLCMNDPHLSLRLNENDLSQKQHQNLFLYYFSPRPVLTPTTKDPCDEEVRSSRYGQITASVSVHQKGSLHEQPKTITTTNPYVRVYVTRSYHKGYVPEFQAYMSRLLRYYEEKSTTVLETYKTYSKACASFMALPYGEGEKAGDTDKDYVNKYPALYKIPGTNYKRKDCQKNKQPVTITREELEDLGLKPEEYLVYPKETVEGVAPEIYRCVHPVFRYPGLKTISNNTSTVFRYYPCCYEVPKLESANYKEYYHNVPPPKKQEKGTKTAYIVREENKIIHNVNQIAEIPLILKQFFCFMNPVYSYFRLGTPIGINSLLYCVLMADRNRDVKDPKNYKLAPSAVDHVRTSLPEIPENIDLILQENTDRTRAEIIDDLVQNRTFLDPRRYGVLLGYLYRARIIVLERIGNRIQPISYHTNRNHYSYRSSLPYLFVYMHYGSTDEAKTLSYPHCELILYKNLELDKIMFHFPHSAEIDRVMSVCVRYFSQDRLISPIPPFDDPWIVGQTIDVYGKLRILHVEYKGKKSSLFLSEPQAPLYKPCITIGQYKDILVYEEAREMMGDTIVGQYEIGHPSLTLLRIRHEPIDLYTVIHRTASVTILKGLPGLSLLTWIRHEMDLHQQERSEQHEYRRVRLTSLAIQDVVMYMYSRHGTDKDIPTFLEENTVIEPGYVYPIDWEQYDFRFGNIDDFLRDGRIILPSLSFRKRLGYLLLWKQEYEKDVLDRYKEARVMPFYLRDIQEYRSMSGQLVVMRDALPEIRRNTVWREYPYERTLRDKTEPYIFVRKGDDLVLTVSCATQKEAVCTLDGWKTKGYIERTGECEADEREEAVIEEDTRYYPLCSLSRPTK